MLTCSWQYRLSIRRHLSITITCWSLHTRLLICLSWNKTNWYQRTVIHLADKVKVISTRFIHALPVYAAIDLIHSTLQVLWKIVKKIKVCLWNTMPRQQQSQKLFLASKSKSRSRGNWPLVSFERISLVEYACQIWSLYLLWFKSYSEC